MNFQSLTGRHYGAERGELRDRCDSTQFCSSRSLLKPKGNISRLPCIFIPAEPPTVLRGFRCEATNKLLLPRRRLFALSTFETRFRDPRHSRSRDACLLSLGYLFSRPRGGSPPDDALSFVISIAHLGWSSTGLSKLNQEVFQSFQCHNLRLFTRGVESRTKQCRDQPEISISLIALKESDSGEVTNSGSMQRPMRGSCVIARCMSMCQQLAIKTPSDSLSSSVNVSCSSG